MTAGTLILFLIATTGWLWLNWRALQAHQLAFELKAAMAAGWMIIIAGLTFVLSRLGY